MARTPRTRTTTHQRKISQKVHVFDVRNIGNKNVKIRKYVTKNNY